MTNLLYRTAAIAAPPSGEGRTVFGIVVPYGVRALVSDGLGEYPERFAPGAFTRSIAERGHKVRLFTQHDRRSLPVGRAVELTEQPDGLHAAFELARTTAADDALELVRSGVIDAFSVGFRPVRERTEHDGTVVRLEAALNEVSLVDSPAYADALVAGVRSAVPRLSVDIAARRLTLILNTWS